MRIQSIVELFRGSVKSHLAQHEQTSVYSPAGSRLVPVKKVELDLATARWDVVPQAENKRVASVREPQPFCGSRLVDSKSLVPRTASAGRSHTAPRFEWHGTRRTASEVELMTRLDVAFLAFWCAAAAKWRFETPPTSQ